MADASLLGEASTVVSSIFHDLSDLKVYFIQINMLTVYICILAHLLCLRTTSCYHFRGFFTSSSIGTVT
jgi:hypothetical protein